MTESVSFQVDLTDIESKDKAGSQKFVVDKDVRMSLSSLQDKVITVFPSLQNKIFSVNWTDEEGDIVTIASDDELGIALTEMKGPVYNIQIRVMEGVKNDESDNPSNVIVNLTCNGCEKYIEGFRYKCLVCVDYDLCGNCETAGVHPDHNMVKIANAGGNFPQHFFKRLHRMQEKIERRRLCRQGRQENLDGEPDGEEDSEIHGARFGGAGRGRRGRGIPRGRGMLGGRGMFEVRGGHQCRQDKPENEAEDTEVENDNQFYGKRLGRAGRGRRGYETFGPHGGQCGGFCCRKKKNEIQVVDNDGKNDNQFKQKKLGGAVRGRQERGIYGPCATLRMAKHNPLPSGEPRLGPHSAQRMAKHNPLPSGGPCLGLRAAQRMARHNPLVYQSLLQATLSNTLAPTKLKMLPRRRTMNLRKKRILIRQMRGKKSTKCCSPLRHSSTTNMPQPQPIDPSGKQ